MPIIEVNDVTKEYQLGQLQSLKTSVLNQWRRLTGQPIEERTSFKALDNVNFSAEQGEVLGIIDASGVGKSTLFKVLSESAFTSQGAADCVVPAAPKHRYLDSEMPEISRFFGMIIAMYYDDNAPPHFHVRYGEQKAIVAIESLAVIQGKLSPKALGLVMEWAAQLSTRKNY